MGHTNVAPNFGLDVVAQLFAAQCALHLLGEKVPKLILQLPLEVRSVMVENFAPRSTILKHDHCLAAAQLANVIVLVFNGSLWHLLPSLPSLLLSVPLGKS